MQNDPKGTARLSSSYEDYCAYFTRNPSPYDKARAGRADLVVRELEAMLGSRSHPYGMHEVEQMCRRFGEHLLDARPLAPATRELYTVTARAILYGGPLKKRGATLPRSGKCAKWVKPSSAVCVRASALFELRGSFSVRCKAGPRSETYEPNLKIPIRHGSATALLTATASDMALGSVYHTKRYSREGRTLQAPNAVWCIVGFAALELFQEAVAPHLTEFGLQKFKTFWDRFDGDQDDDHTD